MKKIFLVSGLLVMIASFPVYADSLVRVQCEEEDTGTEVYLNGKFVGECPVDAPVNEGTVQLRARKIVNGDYEKLFEKKLRVVEGVSQRVELVMSAPQLTAEAKLRKEAAEVGAQLRAAEAGDLDAMKKMARRYDAGIGVKKDPSKAVIWRNKAEAATAREEMRAANTGNIAAMLNLAARHDTGNGVEQSPSLAQAWREKAAAAKREKTATAKAQVKARERQSKINKINFHEYFQGVVDGNSIGIDKNNVTSVIVTGFPAMTLGAATDLISAPIKSTELNRLTNEADLRPSTWGKPDSMIAQASLQIERNSPMTGNPPLVMATK